MKKLLLSFGIGMTVLSFESQAQNTFPPAGPAGVGTTTPTSDVEIFSPSVPYSIPGATIGNNLSFKITNVKYNGRGVTYRNIMEVWEDYLPPYANPRPAFTIDPFGSVGIGTLTPVTRFNLHDGDMTMTAADDRRVRVISAESDRGMFELRTSRTEITPYIQMGANNNSWRAGQIWTHSTSQQGYPAQMFLDWNHNTNSWVGIMRLVEDNGIAKVTIGDCSDLPGNKNYSLFVERGILTEKVKVAIKSSGDWSDYVFADDYQLKPLDEVEAFINDNKHLPDVPSADEVVKNGIDVAGMDAKLLQKIEELTLYVIDIKKENEKQKAQLAKQAQEIELMKAGK